MNVGKVISGPNRRRRAIGGAIVCAFLGMLFQSGAIAPAAALDALSGPHVFGWGFEAPEGISSDGTHVWVANYGGDSVTELNAATGTLVKVITSAGCRFNQPAAVSVDGTHTWVANVQGDSVTELNAATGALVQVRAGPSYLFDAPSGISSDGTDVWVPNSADNSVTGFPA